MTDCRLFGEVCDVTKGKKVNLVKTKSKNSVPYLLIDTLRGDSPKFFTEDKNYIEAKKDDILLVWDGKIGVTGYGLTGAVGSTIARIRAKEKTNPKYLLYFLVYNYQKLRTQPKGSVIPHINKYILYNLQIRIPSEKKQGLIVAEIEKQLTKLDNSIKLLDSTKYKLKFYRKSLLNNLTSGSATKTIESAIIGLDQGWSPKCHNAPAENNEWGVIKTTAVQAGCFNDTENKKLPSNLNPRLQHELKKGDLLITRAGPRVRVGVCCMIKNTRPKLINCDKVYRLRINQEIAVPEYIELILNSPKYSEEINRMKSGISDSGVNLTQKVFKQILIPLPKIDEQLEIVQKIESKLSVIDKLEQTVNQSLIKTQALRKSILKLAFEGKLVAFDGGLNDGS